MRYIEYVGDQTRSFVAVASGLMSSSMRGWTCQAVGALVYAPTPYLSHLTPKVHDEKTGEKTRDNCLEFKCCQSYIAQNTRDSFASQIIQYPSKYKSRRQTIAAFRQENRRARSNACMHKPKNTPPQGSSTRLVRLLEFCNEIRPRCMYAVNGLGLDCEQSRKPIGGKRTWLICTSWRARCMSSCVGRASKT